MTNGTYHDVDIVSEIDLNLQPRTGTGQLQLRIETIPYPEEVPGQPIWKSQNRDQDGNPHFQLFRSHSHPILAVHGTGYFHLKLESIKVAAHPRGQPVPFLLGRVFALWLEQRGITSLHGASVDLGGRAIALVGQRGAGKSTLASALSRRGFPLLSDDLIPIFPSEREPSIAPGFPVTRLWPDSAALVATDIENLKRVHPSRNKRQLGQDDGLTWARQNKPLTACLLLERGKTFEPLLERLQPANALVQLQTHSHDPALTQAMGLHLPRLAQLARLVAVVPVFRLQYPSEFGSLDMVCECIEHHMANL